MLASFTGFASVWTGIAGGFVIIGGAILALMRWGHSLVVRSVASQLNEIHQEVTANGKDTPRLGDTAARTEAKLDQVIATLRHLDEELDEVKEQLTRHLGWHEGAEDIGRI